MLLAFVGSGVSLANTASTFTVLDASLSSVNVVADVEATFEVSLTKVTLSPPLDVTAAATGLAPTAKATPVAKIVAPINLESVRPSLYLRRENFSRLSFVNIKI